MIFENYLKKIVKENEKQYKNDILSFLQPRIDAVILDCGCENGELTKKISNKVTSNLVYGLEIASENFSQAVSRGINIIACDLNEYLPFKDGMFDIIIASHVLEHLNDTDMFLQEVYRVLAKNGIFIISTPNLAAVLNIIFLILGKQPTIAEVSDKYLVGTISYRRTYVDRVGPAHRRIFTLSAITELLNKYGFKIEGVKCSGYLPFPPLISKILSNIDKLHASNITLCAKKATFYKD